MAYSEISRNYRAGRCARMHRPGGAGENTIAIDCGCRPMVAPRTAAITGAYVISLGSDAVTYLSAAGVVRTPGAIVVPSPRSASVLSTAGSVICPMRKICRGRHERVVVTDTGNLVDSGHCEGATPTFDTG